MTLNSWDRTRSRWHRAFLPQANRPSLLREAVQRCNDATSRMPFVPLCLPANIAMER